jgi:hypothetical protein
VVTEAGLAHLGKLVNLETLNLAVEGRRGGEDPRQWHPYPRAEMERDVWRAIARRMTKPERTPPAGDAKVRAVEGGGWRARARLWIDRARLLLYQVERLLRAVKVSLR